jgi:hypothetical protein
LYSHVPSEETELPRAADTKGRDEGEEEDEEDEGEERDQVMSLLVPDSDPKPRHHIRREIPEIFVSFTFPLPTHSMLLFYFLSLPENHN